MYLGVKAVKPQDDYMLLLTFENDEQGLFDMNIGPIFRALKEPSMFNSVRVYFDTVSWANKADIDPEILYSNSVLVSKE